MRTTTGLRGMGHGGRALPTDVMQQWIDYRVPPDKFDDLASYDGSVVVNRTNGEISARCDREAANFLALNLANEIVTALGRRKMRGKSTANR